MMTSSRLGDEVYGFIRNPDFIGNISEIKSCHSGSACLASRLSGIRQHYKKTYLFNRRLYDAQKQHIVFLYTCSNILQLAFAG